MRVLIKRIKSQARNRWAICYRFYSFRTNKNYTFDVAPRARRIKWFIHHGSVVRKVIHCDNAQRNEVKWVLFVHSGSKQMCTSCFMSFEVTCGMWCTCIFDVYKCTRHHWRGYCHMMYVCLLARTRQAVFTACAKLAFILIHHSRVKI